MLYDDYDYPWAKWERSKSLHTVSSMYTINNSSGSANQYGSTSSEYTTENGEGGLTMTIGRCGDEGGLADVNSSPIPMKRFVRSQSVNAGNGGRITPISGGGGNGGENRMNRKGISLKKLKKW